MTSCGSIRRGPVESWSSYRTAPEAGRITTPLIVPRSPRTTQRHVGRATIIWVDTAPSRFSACFAETPVTRNDANSASVIPLPAVEAHDLVVTGQRFSCVEFDASVMVSGHGVLTGDGLTVTDGAGWGIYALGAEVTLTGVDVSDVGDHGIVSSSSAFACTDCTVQRAEQVGVLVEGGDVRFDRLSVLDIAARGGRARRGEGGGRPTPLRTAKPRRREHQQPGGPCGRQPVDVHEGEPRLLHLRRARRAADQVGDELAHRGLVPDDQGGRVSGAQSDDLLEVPEHDDVRRDHRHVGKVRRDDGSRLGGADSGAVEHDSGLPTIGDQPREVVLQLQPPAGREPSIKVGSRGRLLLGDGVTQDSDSNGQEGPGAGVPLTQSVPEAAPLGYPNSGRITPLAFAAFATAVNRFWSSEASATR